MADLQKKRFRLNYNMVLILICLVLFLGFGLVRSSFFSGKYIVDVLKMAVEIGIIVLPTTLLVIMGCIDFSMCAVLSLAAVISGIVTTQTNGFVGLLACLLVGVLCGSFNGLLVAVLRLPPMVTTLATMYLFKGIAEGITLGTSIGTNVAGTPLAMFLGNGTFLFIPTQFWVYAILALAFYYLLAKTPFGRTLYAIGLNEDGARFAGINTVRNKFLVYVLSGVVFSIAGLVFMGRFSTIQYNSADSYLMQIIIAAVLGGADMNGGRGDIRGSVLGVLIIGILKGGMNVLLLPQTTQKIVLGFLLLVTLIIFEVLNHRDRGIVQKKPQPVQTKQS